MVSTCRSKKFGRSRTRKKREIRRGRPDREMVSATLTYSQRTAVKQRVCGGFFCAGCDLVRPPATSLGYTLAVKWDPHGAPRRDSSGPQNLYQPPPVIGRFPHRISPSLHRALFDRARGPSPRIPWGPSQENDWRKMRTDVEWRSSGGSRPRHVRSCLVKIGRGLGCSDAFYSNSI